MKSWQRETDGVLLDSLKMTALMSFCFGVGLLASSIIGVGPKTQLAETISINDNPNFLSTSTNSSSGANSSGGNSTVIQTTTTQPNPAGPGATVGSGLPSNITPSLTFTSAVPSVVASNFTITLNAVSVQNPRLVIRGLNVNKIINLEPASQQSPIFNFLVRFEQLPVGIYEIVAKAYSPNGSIIELVGPRFEVPPPTGNQPTNPNTSSGPSSTSTTTNPNVNSGAGSVGPTSSSSTSNITNTASTSVNSLEGNEGNLVPEPELEVPELDLILPNQTRYSGFVPVQVRTTVSLPEAFIYLQSSNFTTPRFVGKARYYNGSTLLLMVDTTQIPNGEHRIYALAKFTDVDVESEKRRFLIENSTSTNAVISNPVVSTTTNPNITTPPIIQPKPATVEPNITPTAPVYVPPKVQPKEEVKVVKNADVERVAPLKTGVSNESKSVTLSDPLKTLIPQLLKEYEKEINDRLKTFAEDLHTVDADVSVLRKKAVDDLMSILLNDYRLRTLSTEAKKRLRAEVERLVDRAERVELLIKKAEVNSATLDEAIKAFSDESVIVEGALVDTTSPREFGLVREDILKIESVLPVMSVDVVSTTTKIYTEIKGRAIPNSLVTLYIYSTPVMVTVRADADGTFLYVYEKDLDDGDHEVYVALTTTEGDVVVKSPSFQFIREAQAFNSPDSGNGDSLIPATEGTPLTRNPYFIVLSITLLVLSLIFFLLGFQTVKKSGVNRLV